MLVKVTSTITENELNYVIRFSLPPLYKGGRERGRLRLPIPKKVVTEDCTLYFGRLPTLYPRRIRIVSKKDVFVEKGVAYPAPTSSIWKVFIEVSPDRIDDC